MNYVNVSRDELLKVASNLGYEMWEGRLAKGISSRRIIADYIGEYFHERFGFKASSVDAFIGAIETGMWISRLKKVCLNEEHPESDPSVVLFYAYIDVLGVEDDQRRSLYDKLSEICSGFPKSADKDYERNRFSPYSVN